MIAENLLKCMEFVDDADRIADGLENEDQLIMLVGTMTDR